MELVRLLWLLSVVISVRGKDENAITEKEGPLCKCSEKRNCPPKFQSYTDHTACMSTSKLLVEWGVTEEQKKEILNLHNKYRGEIYPVATNMLKMNWDDELSMVAQRWANACVMDKYDRFKHDVVRNIPGRFTVGQNFGYGQKSFTEVIVDWYGEKELYDQLFGHSKSNLAGIGHYTQVVWAETNKIGCGYSKCKTRRFYVCNYAPAGNVIPFSKPYANGPRRCSDCKKCSSGLCDCGDLACTNGGFLDTKTCTCRCSKKPYIIGPDCYVNCGANDLSFCETKGSNKDGTCNYNTTVCKDMCTLCACLRIPSKDQCNEKPTTGTSATSRAAILLALLALLLSFEAPRLRVC